MIATREDAERFAAILGEAAQQRAPHLGFGGARVRPRPFRRKPVPGHEAGRRHFRRWTQQPGSARGYDRDELVRQGITINGLPLMTNGGLSSAYDVTDLDKYYADCVIGGPGAFMIPVNDWSQFPEAISRKLVLELAGPLSPAWLAEAAEDAPVVLAQRRRPTTA